MALESLPASEHIPSLKELLELYKAAQASNDEAVRRRANETVDDYASLQGKAACLAVKIAVMSHDA